MQCLLCNKPEKNRNGKLPFICATCVRTLQKSRQEDIDARYAQAMREKRHAVAYALASFASRGIREKYPMKNGGRIRRRLMNKIQ